MSKTTPSQCGKNVPIARSSFRTVFPIVATLFCLSLILVVDCFAAENKTEIKYGYPSQSIFVATINGKEQPITPMLLVAQELFGRADLSWQATSYPARRLFRNFKSGETNFSILVRASSLVESCLFSQKPIYSTDLNVYSMGNKAPIHSIGDLRGARVITIGGYSYGKLKKFLDDPKNNITKVVINTHSSAFGMLELGRGDYLLDYASAAEDIVAARSLPELRSSKIDELKIYLVLSKTYPNAEEVMKRLETIMESIDVKEILRKSGIETGRKE